MELSVKIFIACVMFPYVFSEDQHLHYENTEKPLNVTNPKQDRAVNLRKHIVECAEETKLNPEIVLNLRSGKWIQATRKEPEKLKKWCLCLLVKSNMMSSDGVLRQDVVLTYVPERDRAKVENVIDKCLFKKRHSPIEIAWHYVTCFRQRFSKYSII